jgi:hypothetical protein
MRAFVVTTLAILWSVAAAAQSAILNLPRTSQHARVMQRIGLTDITIDYHRPLVRGRKIFGGLQPYGDVWRAGANEITTFAVTDPVRINGAALDAGVYGLHMIPGETTWSVIFSKNSTSWGSFTYDPTEDALRVAVTPTTTSNQEVLSYEFDHPTPTTTDVTMRWEKVQLSLTVTVDTPTIVRNGLKGQLRTHAQFEWQPWMEAADYLLANNIGIEDALLDAQKSIEIEDRFENELMKSRALSAADRPSEARAARDRAISLGTQAQLHSYARGLQADGHHDEALDLFRANIKKDPDSWIAHNEAARLAVAKGDFTTAVREMKLAAVASPAALKGQHADLLRRLERHDDINR